MNLNEVRHIVEEWARQVGEIQLRYFRSADLEISTKYNDFDVVTRADKESEALIISRINETFPDHDILAEESGEYSRRSSWRWIVDPLDGTTNFSQGLPLFCVSIALEHDGEPVVGVVYAPYLNEMFSAVKDAGATLNGCPIHCSKKTSLNMAVVSTGLPVDKKENRDNNLSAISKVGVEVRGLRRLGSAAIDLCYTAAGILDGYWELALHRWDISAGSLIASEAGATVGYFRPYRPYSILAATPALYPELLALISERN